MTADKLPSVLYVPCSTPGYSNSLSVERVLKNAIDLIDELVKKDWRFEMRASVAIDDLEEMLKRIDR